MSHGTVGRTGNGRNGRVGLCFFGTVIGRVAFFCTCETPTCVAIKGSPSRRCDVGEASSAASAAKAIGDHMRDWVLGTTVLSAPRHLFDHRHPPEFTPKRVFDRRHIAAVTGDSAPTAVKEQEIHVLNGTYGDQIIFTMSDHCEAAPYPTRTLTLTPP